ncbi:MAG: RNA methyltransferase [Clostridia bacterium]|nr:RNA methyltransferase [Clostridia bacterium]
MIISSKQNAEIKRIASLKEKKYREEYGEYLVEGVKMVKEAILSGAEVREIVGVDNALKELPPVSVSVKEVSGEVFARLSETKTPQGVMAVVKKPRNEALPPRGNCAVLDGISDPGNLGTIIRTSAALGIKDVYLVNCADAFSPKTVRASMSGIYYVNLRAFNAETVYRLISKNNIIVADMDGKNVFGSDVKKPYALVIGNEANGVSGFFKGVANETVSVPMDGKVESLNAAVAFAVIAYAIENK